MGEPWAGHKRDKAASTLRRKDNDLVSWENFGFEPPMGSKQSRDSGFVSLPKGWERRGLGWAKQGQRMACNFSKALAVRLLGELWLRGSNWFC